MTTDSPSRARQSRAFTPSRLSARAAALALTSALALSYAALAGLRTVGDPDLGWQLATGRWIVQHRLIPSTDILSYTAQGKEWIYPALSQVLLYLSYQAGGYSLLSWLGAAACAGTILLLLRRGTAFSKLLAVIAVPLIAARTPPRAEMFTELLFAAFVSLLWRFHKSGHGPLWALPPLMCLWVNLHLGFIAGLGMCAAYILLELGEAAFTDERKAALSRLRLALPWLLATAAATLVNPWGPKVYAAIARQGNILRIHNQWVVEWMRIPLTPARFAEALEWRDPRSALWWLLAAVLLAILASIYRRRFVPAAILAVSSYLVLHSARLQGPFASIAVIIGGTALTEGLEAASVRALWEQARPARFPSAALPWALALACTALVAVRGSDLVSNRYYLRTCPQFSLFGPGESSWYPEQAAGFISQGQIPGNLFHEFNLGGFVSWRLWPSYPDYIDGRSVPFGGPLFFQSMELLQVSPDGARWEREAESRNINTLFVSMDPVLGGGLANLDAFCHSQRWRPVHLDTNAAVFVRVRPETAALLQKSQLDCASVRFDTPPPGDGVRARSERFRYYLNSAAILVALGRNQEAVEHGKAAQSLCADNGALHYIMGIALRFLGDWRSAEEEFRTSLQLDRSDDVSLELARLYAEEKRYAEAALVLMRAIEYSPQPYHLQLQMAYTQLGMENSEQALLWFDEAEKRNPFIDDAAPLGATFFLRLAQGRTLAWQKLAQSYEARGLHVQALEAQRQAALAARSAGAATSVPEQP